MPSLPFLLSIPHGGTAIPEELQSRIQISEQEILADGDPFTGDIYDTGNDVQEQVKFDIARALIDVNRAPDDLPPQNPDGVMKSVSIFNNSIYRTGLEPDLAEMSSLIKKYYEPYHVRMLGLLDSKKIKFAFDCHSMEGIGPPVAKDFGKKRPLFCLGNNNGKSCSEKHTIVFAHCLAEAYSIPLDSITVNAPFSGGYITQRYGMNPVPWLQVEMNRNLYLQHPWYQKDTNLMSGKRLRELNSSFKLALKIFKERYD